MAFVVKTTLVNGQRQSPWVQITDAQLRIRVFSDEVMVEIADDATGTNAGAVSNEAEKSGSGVFRAPIREYLAAETGAFYRLSAVGAQASGDLSSGAM